MVRWLRWGYAVRSKPIVCDMAHGSAAGGATRTVAAQQRCGLLEAVCFTTWACIPDVV
jgi:hypothetical protein